MGLVGFWGKRGGSWGRAYLGSDGGLGVGCDTGVGFGLSGPWEGGRGGGGLMAFYIVNLGWCKFDWGGPIGLKFWGCEEGLWGSKACEGGLPQRDLRGGKWGLENFPAVKKKKSCA